MASQQMQIAETIRAVKLAMKRRADDFDGGDYIDQHTNRGNKLKRNARYVKQDQLDDTGGTSYKKKINHAGYLRTTISTNPLLYDEDGDVYSPVSSDNEDRFAEPIEDNPFGDVHLEHLLRPLTAAAELPAHPSLSIPYKSKALTQMADEAFEMLRRERASLWKAKRLLQRFRGDADWVPCTTFETENDDMLLHGDDSLGDFSAVPSVFTDNASFELGPPRQLIDELDAAGDDLTKRLQTDGIDAIPDGEAMEGVEALDMAAFAANAGISRDIDTAGIEGAANNVKQNSNAATNGESGDGAEEMDMNGHSHMSEDDANGTTLGQASNPTVADLAEREGASETASNSNGTNTHAMTTRARARSPAERSDRTPSPSPSDSASIPPIHPWFVAPAAALTNRDLGLPPNEAEETRKLLLLYVQKQEQIVRSLDSLHAGLAKADRLRNYVYRSCKADGHVVPDGKGNMVTEMSDGEDWYDVSDWNMQPWELNDGHLEKGKDEVEDVEEEGRRRPGRGRRVNRM
ncbi:hypothetical protein DOTSEDRAFT_138511 [Dothistroma septosporum NZE10]|uniref:Transcriptional regulatory protein RXT2 N-terminal domain-containing protein n=1 Tax=Dothistroma septosporum (strain NZE10 / CBS 128990) TaxID=675120 RepID=M2YKQ9_DOTSN|nr:hypothetical protein DOTSEDRAFT_138511 [Dothistroma septosporum NZE10]